MNLKNQTTLLRSMEFANWGHRNQKRKISGTPFIIHPFHVRCLLTMSGLNPDIDDHVPIFIAGDNHDGPEDNDEVTFELIEREFGAEVARIIKGVTLDPKNPDNRLSRQKILGLDWKIKIVKVADITSNTMSLTAALKIYGLSKVQKHFTQLISERIAMEREFIGAIPCTNEPVYLVTLIKFALSALSELKHYQLTTSSRL